LIHDVTEVKRLESIRRDFVASVSHELKTPVTAIRATFETLLDGAMNDSGSLEKFLKIVANTPTVCTPYSKTCSRWPAWKYQGEKRESLLASGPVREVLEAAVTDCAPGPRTGGCGSSWPVRTI